MFNETMNEYFFWKQWTFNETMPIFLETIDEFSDVATAQQQHGLIEQLNDQVNIIFPDHPHFSINIIIVFLTITLFSWPHCYFFRSIFKTRHSPKQHGTTTHWPNWPNSFSGYNQGLTQTSPRHCARYVKSFLYTLVVLVVYLPVPTTLWKYMPV